MNPEAGYYSLLQYCPNLSRLEAVNVGVALYLPGRSFLRVQVDDENKRIARAFGKGSFDPALLAAARLSIRNRLARLESDGAGLEAVKRYVEGRANDWLFSPLRPIKVAEPEAELQRLFAELVEVKPAKPVERSAVVPAVVRRTFADLARQGLARAKQWRVKLPFSGATMTVPFAYLNGAVNLVKPQRFAADEQQAGKAAMHLAIEGDLLQSRLDQNQHQRRLIVLASFPPSPKPKASRDSVLATLKKYKVEVVQADEANQFADRVRQEAKPWADAA